jgi:hypothetical protein
MVLSIVLVYVTGALFLGYSHEFSSHYGADDPGTLLVFSIAFELAVASIADAIWVHESFWIHVLLPVFASTIVFMLYHVVLIRSYGPDPTGPLRAPRALEVLVRRVGTRHIAQTLLLSSVCFTLVVFDVRAITSSIVSGKWLSLASSASAVYVLNSYAMLLSVLWMATSLLLFNLKVQFSMRKARRQYPLDRHRGYDVRLCHCVHEYEWQSIGHCRNCHGTRRVEIEAPSAKCTRCSGLGMVKERKRLTGSAFDLGIDVCPDCCGVGWVTDRTS